MQEACQYLTLPKVLRRQLSSGSSKLTSPQICQARGMDVQHRDQQYFWRY